MNGFEAITRDQLLELVVRLVEHPSEQSAALEDDPAVRSLAPTCVEPFVSRFGLSPQYDPMGNMLLQTGPSNAPLALAVFAYAMTHPGAAMSEPFKCIELPSPRGGRLRGRGISEQKAALAASLAAFLEVSASTAPRERIAWILLTAGETGRHLAMESALDTLGETPRYAILAIGTAGRIDIGHRGRLDIEVRIVGRAAHSSAPQLGIDATRGVEIILARARRIAANLPEHPDLGPALLTCTSIHTAPNATHTVQAEAALTFDRRILPQESVADAFDDIRRALRLDPPLQISIERGAFMHAHLLPSDSPLLTRALRALQANGLSTPPFGFSSGALDAGYLQQLGSQAFMWGPGDPRQFHTTDEHVDVDDIIHGAECYRAVLADGAGRAGPG